MTTSAVSTSITDPVNRAILAVSEDLLEGFQPDPLGEIARLSGLSLDLVAERIRAMLTAGTIRRVRQTLVATNLADGALVAWKVPQARIEDAFDFMFRKDPFSGHVVIRSTDADTAGSAYRLWTTLKVPQGFSLHKHATYLEAQVGAEAYRAMPARCFFALGVGHVRRAALTPGSAAHEPAEVRRVRAVELSEIEWAVVMALKREFEPEELVPDIWQRRADEARVSLAQFVEVGRSLDRRGLLGRFSTFLEHVKPLPDGSRVTSYNALFHWAVPRGREIEAGREVGRHHIVTHAYWREGGPEFANVNIMAVVHGTEKTAVLAHKTAIDGHLAERGIAFSYTNVFWGGRSEIKPSEIAPQAYIDWCRNAGLNPDDMRAGPNGGLDDTD